jgi:hypothetical protein
MKIGVTTNIVIVVLVCTLNGILVHTILNDYYNFSVLAQTSNGTIQTRTQPISKADISVVEKIIAPAQKTTVTVNQTTLYVSPQVLQSLQGILDKTRIPNP